MLSAQESCRDDLPDLINIYIKKRINKKIADRKYFGDIT